MKRLLFLVPGDSSYKKPIGNAFKKLNWKVLYYDYRKGSLWIRILRFIPLFGGRSIASKAIDKEIQYLNKVFKPNLILTAKGELLSKELMGQLKNKRNVTVNLFPDYLNHWELIKKIAPSYDYFFTFDKLTIKRLKRAGINNTKYLPQATEVEKYQIYKKKYDVTFIGTYNPWREKYLSVLKDLGLVIFGDKRWLESSLEAVTKGPRMKLSKMKNIIKKSKINLNIFFDDYTEMEGVSLRPYEITGSGSFLLTQFVKDFPSVYRIGKEMDWFRNPGEMRKKVLYYLKNEELREEMAKNGYERTIRDHTYDIRIKQMLEMINLNV